MTTPVAVAPSGGRQRPPLYDTGTDPETNQAGPRGILPWLPVSRRTVPPGARTKLFGRRIRGVVGVPACPLTANASWVSALAGAGFDVLTHKTVRSAAWTAHPFPQWLLGTAVPTGTDVVIDTAPGTAAAGPGTTSGNSFGVPSPDPAVWQADLRRCRRALGVGQVLIASVMGSPELYSGVDLVVDFIRVARLAAETGVEAVELNLSCPNTLNADSAIANAPLCADAGATATVVGGVRAALPRNVHLVVKLSALPPAALREVVGRVAPLVEAIAGVNAIQQRLLDTSGEPAFGAPRAYAGLSGAAIREQGLGFVREVRQCRQELGADFAILGMGGVLGPADVRDYLDAGADVVQAATGACLDAELANRSRQVR